jgi:hypothetical protein
MMHGTHNVKKK